MVIGIPGDVINTKIECYGLKRVGSKLLTKQNAVKVCDKFFQGVQVNFITGACHSGISPEAIRDGGQKRQFTAAASSTDSTAITYMSLPATGYGTLKCHHRVYNPFRRL